MEGQLIPLSLPSSQNSSDGDVPTPTSVESPYPTSFGVPGMLSDSFEEPDAYEGQVLALEDVPDATYQAVTRLAAAARNCQVSRLRFLLMGAPGVGKSSLINSLLNEKVCAVSAFERGTRVPSVHAREVDSVVLEFVDTPGLVSEAERGMVPAKRTLMRVRQAVGNCAGDDKHLRAIHVVLYVMRLDETRPDFTDYLNLRLLVVMFGERILEHLVFVYTHGQSLPPAQLGYLDYLRGRYDLAQSYIAEVVGPQRAPRVPVYIAENSPKCPVIEATGERKLPDGTPWLTQLYDGLRLEIFPHENETLALPAEQVPAVRAYTFDRRVTGMGDGRPQSWLRRLVGNAWFIVGAQLLALQMLTAYAARKEYELENPKQYEVDDISVIPKHEREAMEAEEAAKAAAAAKLAADPSPRARLEEATEREFAVDQKTGRLQRDPEDYDLHECLVEREISEDGRVVRTMYLDKDNPEMMREYHIEVMEPEAPPPDTKRNPSPPTSQRASR